MTLLIGLLCAFLVVAVLIQIGRVSELAADIRGARETQLAANSFHARFGLIFLVLFLAGTIISAWYYRPFMLYYGPNLVASEHGYLIDRLFNWTLVLTGIVFILTQIFLFWYAWKYRERENTKSVFWAHDSRLEMIWMAIPAVAMTFLVVMGMAAWNKIMTDIPADAVLGKDYIEVEATGYQFAWALRHPGPDNQLGDRNFRLTSAENPLGQDWVDKRNLDDIQPDQLVLPVGMPVRVRITSKDVLHNFYLPHFRVKMDAVPGMPTYFIFTPTITTDSMRAHLSHYPEWNEPAKLDPEKKRWEFFDYELACAELCGRGHYSMRRIVKIVTPEQYKEWLAGQKSYYASSVQGKPGDPYLEPVKEEAPTPIKEGSEESENKSLSSR
jgi:cytochrome c oxidase subunit 2